MKKIVYLFVALICNSYSYGQTPQWTWVKSVETDSTGIENNHIVSDHYGNIYVAGDFAGTLDFDPDSGVTILSSPIYSSVFIANYNANGNLIWAKQCSGDQWAEVSAMAIDDSGHVYIVGSFEGTLDLNPDAIATYNITSNTFYDMFLIKLDSAGNFIWGKQFGGSGYEYASSICIDQFNAVYLTGFFTSDSMDFDPGAGTYFNTAPDTGDAFVLKLNTSGNFVWVETFGTNFNSAGSSIKATADGNIIVAGIFGGTADFNPDTSIVYNLTAPLFGSDNFILKLDSSGGFIYAKQIEAGANNVLVISAIEIDDENNVYLTGVYGNSVDFNPGSSSYILTSAGNYDVFFLKLDSAGEFQWAKSIGGSAIDGSGGLALDTAGNLVSDGFFYGTSDLDPDSIAVNNFIANGNDDIWLMKLTPAGDLVWLKTAGGMGLDFEYYYSVTVDESDNIYITGGTGSDSIAFDSILLIDTIPHFGNMFIAKIASCINTSATISVSQCSSFTSPSGSYTWSSSGIYEDIIPNASGCDSIITINLTIGDTHDTLIVTACNSYTSPSGNYTWTVTGTYIDTIPNATGCDSVLTINLIINNSSSSVTVTSCYTYLSPSGNYTWSASGAYIDTILNSMNCDSIIFIHLTIAGNTYSTQTINACNSSVSPSGNYTWTHSGIYNDTITNSSGCDSILTILLTIHNTLSAQTVTACNSFTSPSNNYNWTASGVYQDTIPSVFGCDSIITINLIINTADTAVTESGVTLTATAAGATCQWLNCDSSFTAIAGATNQTYTATTNGSYSVAITQNGCTDTSGCYTVTGVGIDEINGAADFMLYPNPATNLFTIQLNTPSTHTSVTLTNTLGEVVQTMAMLTRTMAVDISTLPAGIYFVRVQTDAGVAVKKVVKE